MNQSIENMKCPFCGKHDIEYGLALCASCHADIRYDLVERDTGTEADLKILEGLEQQVAKATRDFDNTSWPFNMFAHKRLVRLGDEMEVFVQGVTSRAEEKVDKRLQRGDTTSIATFTRGDRNLDVTVYIPVDPNASTQTEYDVVLVAPGNRLINVVKELRAITGAGLSEAKRMTDEVPTTILSGVDLNTAEQGKAALEKLGASVEVR